MENFSQERERILEVYKIYDMKRDDSLAHLLRVQERHRQTLCLLKAYGFHPPWCSSHSGCGLWRW